MFLSAIVASEFEVMQPVSDLPMNCFNILNFNMIHAATSGSLYRSLKASPDTATKPVDYGARHVIINDIKIIAQAQCEDISVIIAEDKKTLAKIVEKLRNMKQCNVRCALLCEGFDPSPFVTGEQGELQF